MVKYLIVYGTRQGQTEKISNFISNELVNHGNTTDIFNVKNIPDNLDLSMYDAYIVGAPIQAGGYPKQLKKWVKLNNFQLSKKPSAFFSVCLGVLQNDELVQKEVREYVQNLFSWSGWTPQTWVIFAGALAYSKYNWLVKIIMRQIARKAGVETDIHKDYEYTNWESVKEFANSLTPPKDF